MKHLNTTRNLLIASALFFALLLPGFAQKASDFDLPAVGGYDLVSYQKMDKPLRRTLPSSIQRVLCLRRLRRPEVQHGSDGVRSPRRQAVPELGPRHSKEMERGQARQHREGRQKLADPQISPAPSLEMPPQGGFFRSMYSPLHDMNRFIPSPHEWNQSV